ncbi:MAG: MarR family transcriptional regulator [Candidatus Thorarchaeota archaeon]|jgi:DNA-binding transcriptional regulator GbsR (MarR family)
MNKVNVLLENQINRILGICVEWLGLQRSAANILAPLYILKNNSNEALSMDELCRITNLSHSTVSSICSQLESLDLLKRELDGTTKARGRKRSAFSLRVGVDGLLKVGIQRNINHVLRILNDLQNIKSRIVDKETEIENAISMITEEICCFLESPWQERDMEVYE